MPSEAEHTEIAVFDLGGTWFRWGRYVPAGGLLESQRVAAINYLTHPQSSATELQQALADFIIQRTGGTPPIRRAGVSIGAPVNAHDCTVLGSGPLWGPSARPFRLLDRLSEALPEVHWHVLNDVTALLAPYMEAPDPIRKTLLITISTGVGSRLFDHRSGRIPHDATHGVQGEIGHLAVTFELDGEVVNRRCECGGWNHLNAFSSGRGIAQTLQHLGLQTFKQQLDAGEAKARTLLDAFVTPISRVLATGLSLDPEIDRIVITGGVAQGLGQHYRDALQRTFIRDGLYQISDNDPHYLTRRLVWEEPDESGGLRGAGMYVAMNSQARTCGRNKQ